MPQAAPIDPPTGYDPAAIFVNFDERRRWYILVTQAVGAERFVAVGVQRLVAERALAVGIDVYFPVGLAFGRKAEIERAVWGCYVAAAMRPGVRAGLTISSAPAIVRGVSEVLGNDAGPFHIPANEILGWRRRQLAGDLDEGERVRRRLFPRWCRKGYPARIIGGMTTFFARALEGIIVSRDSPEDIGVEVDFMGSKRIVHAPLVFLEKAG